MIPLVAFVLFDGIDETELELSAVVLNGSRMQGCRTYGAALLVDIGPIDAEAFLLAAAGTFNCERRAGLDRLGSQNRVIENSVAAGGGHILLVTQRFLSVQRLALKSVHLERAPRLEFVLESLVDFEVQARSLSELEFEGLGDIEFQQVEDLLELVVECDFQFSDVVHLVQDGFVVESYHLVLGLQFELDPLLLAFARTVDPRGLTGQFRWEGRGASHLTAVLVHVARFVVLCLRREYRLFAAAGQRLRLAGGLPDPDQYIQRRLSLLDRNFHLIFRAKIG